MRTNQFIHKVIFILGISFLFMRTLLAQDSLKILSWNIQMLPSLAKSNGKVKRARAIVNQLNQKDNELIVFQELFHKRSRRIVTDGLSPLYPHHTQILNKRFLSFKANGGVMIFSKYRIHQVHQIRFKDRTGFDRLARKGAMLAEVEVKGKLIQVIGTHMQAFGTQEILYSQYQQLAQQLIEPHCKDGVPQLICGDFNTLKSLPPELPPDISQDFIDRLPRYFTMLQTLQAEDGRLEGEQQFTMDRPFNDLCKTRKEYRLLLDYVLIRSNSANDYLIKRQVQIIRQRWHKEHVDLSDHFGLEAVMTGY